MYKTRLCRQCGVEFTPWAPQCRYCCMECRSAAKKDTRERAKQKRKGEKKPTPAVSVAEVLRFADDYKKRTGYYPHYGEAVTLMEKERSGSQ